MSLKLNILANYASQIYVTIAGIIMLPLYIQYMGAEAYGLVGFFAMLQMWFQLFDMGFTPTIARETARFHGGELDILSYRHVVRALEGIFISIALLGGLVLFTCTNWIATHWLYAIQLPVSQISITLKLISVVISLRWMCGLYRSIISGAEKLVWLSIFNASIATLRFVLVLPVLIFINAEPLAFFSFQLSVAILELIGLMLFAYCLLPSVPIGHRISWRWASLKPIFSFSFTIAFTSSVWVIVTQTDKLMLSKILPLAEYGYFTIAVLVASGIFIMSGPISSAIMPRMARLEAEGKHEQVIAVYRQATQLVIVITMPIALVLTVFSEQVLWIWTGDFILVEKAAPILKLYAAGYGILAVSAFPYYLQYAKGNLKLHLLGSILYICLLIPSIIWATLRYGMIGAGWAWLISNIVYFFAWVPLVHQRFSPGLHFNWLLKDIARPSVLAALCAFCSSFIISWTNSRIILGFELVAIGILLLLFSYALADRVKLLNQRETIGY